MKKKLSLSNLSKNEVKKSDMKEMLAGQNQEGYAGKGYEYGGGAGRAAVAPAAAPRTCYAWCSCTCFVGDVESTMDNIGIGGAINEFFINPM
jgi:hypothetical protein